MPKATLSFNLPEEKELFELAVQGIDYSIVIEDLDNWLRTKVKYEDLEVIEITKVREELWRLMEERGLK